MNRIVLSLLFFVSSLSWAEDEFPIELTCESGLTIIYLHLEETAEKSWFIFHESSRSAKGGPLKKKLQKFKTEKGEIKRIKYERDNIYVNLKSLTSIYIHRYNLTVHSGASAYVFAGQCYKGFKEYEKQI